ncbi:MAG: lysine biosynthesis protein LysW [bacterium]|nr:lysine biosynthesis protein LysW [bacterium]
MQTAKCPVCNSDIIIEEEAFKGDLAGCVNCGAELEIISLHPLQIAIVESDLDEELAGQTDEEEV